MRRTVALFGATRKDEPRPAAVEQVQRGNEIRRACLFFRVFRVDERVDRGVILLEEAIAVLAHRDANDRQGSGLKGARCGQT